jgi:hypothetical protein
MVTHKPQRPGQRPVARLTASRPRGIDLHPACLTKRHPAAAGNRQHRGRCCSGASHRRLNSGSRHHHSCLACMACMACVACLARHARAKTLDANQIPRRV